MDRTLIFRGLTVENNYWTFGDLVQTKDGKSYIVHKKPINDLLSKDNYDEVKHVCQFTGLYDKNGIEIYEGDVIRLDNVTGVVVFDRDICGFAIAVIMQGDPSDNKKYKIMMTIPFYGHNMRLSENCGNEGYKFIDEDDDDKNKEEKI